MTGCALACLIAMLADARAAAAAQTQAETRRSIARVSGDVYRVDVGSEATVFVVGSDGILLGDPLDLDTARWLKAELAARFPDRPVRYMVEAVPALERIGGGAIFRPDVKVIGHADFPETVMRARRIRVQPERWKWVTYPDQMFTTEHTVKFGGKTVRIINTAGEFREDATLMLFMEDRVLFSWSRRLHAGPFVFSRDEAASALEWTRRAAVLPFDVLVTRTGQTVGRSEVDRLAKYLQYLEAEVSSAVMSGRRQSEITARPLPAEFRGDRHAGARQTHVTAMYDAARVRWTDLQANAIYQWHSVNHEFCESFETCESGATLVGGGIGLRLGGRRFGVIAEMAIGDQFVSLRRHPTRDDVFAHRQTRGSLLVSLGGTRLRRPSFNLLAGVSVTIGDSDGVTIIRGGFASFAGRRPLSERAVAVGPTVGSDLVLPISNRFSIVVPLRVTMIAKPPQDSWPGRIDAQGGVGLRLNMHRRVTQ
jgi:hypothetical protein